MTSPLEEINTFLECEVVGDWINMYNELLEINAEERLKSPWTTFSASRDGASIRLVRPDGMIREFSFKKNSEVQVGESAVKFQQKDVLDEHSVDQDVRDGKRGNSTVVNSS